MQRGGQSHRLLQFPHQLVPLAVKPQPETLQQQNQTVLAEQKKKRTPQYRQPFFMSDRMNRDSVRLQPLRPSVLLGKKAVRSRPLLGACHQVTQRANCTSYVRACARVCVCVAGVHTTEAPFMMRLCCLSGFRNRRRDTKRDGAPELDTPLTLWGSGGATEQTERWEMVGGV